MDESGFEVLPLKGFEYRRAKFGVGDGGIENKMADQPQLTGSNVEIFNGA
jgi:hypothetical protein